MREAIAGLLAGLILLAGCSPKAPEPKATDATGQECRRRLEEAKAPLPLLGEAQEWSFPGSTEWNLFEIDGMQVLACISDETSDSEPYGSFHGWVFNQSFQEWRRFTRVKIRNCSCHACKIGVDLDHRVIYLLAADDRHSPSAGKRVLQIDLDILSDDRAYLRARRASEDPRPSSPEIPPDPDK